MFEFLPEHEARIALESGENRRSVPCQSCVADGRKLQNGSGDEGHVRGRHSVSSSPIVQGVDGLRARRRPDEAIAPCEVIGAILDGRDAEPERLRKVAGLEQMMRG